MLSYHRGCVAIKGSQVNEIAQKWINQCQDIPFQKSLKAREGRDDTSGFHITVMAPKEKILTNFDVSQYELLLDPIELYDLGIGRKQDGHNTVYYVVIISPQLEKLRAELQLPHYDFHITLGFTQSDIHDVPKGISTLWMKSNHYAITLHQILEKGPVELPARALRDMGYLVGVFFLFKCVVKSMELKERYNYVRDEVLCREYKQLVSGEDYGDRLVKILNRLSGRTQQSCGKPVNFYTYEIQDGVYQFKTYEMPRNFSFVSEKVAGASKPNDEQHWDAFEAMGVTDVITVMEMPMPVSLHRTRKLNSHFYEVDDRTPPTKQQMLQMMQVIDESEGKVVVHCLGGVGRTATVIVAYLMWSEEVSKFEGKQRLVGRKTILSQVQEDFLTDWYRVCREQTKLNVKLPPIIMMVGYPASGKSTFSKAMADASDSITRINQDEMGRKQCESLAGRTKASGGTVVLDRCNLTAKERKEWLSIMHNRKAWCIYYTVPWEECRWRITRRENHPGIKPGGGLRIMEGLRDTLEPPTNGERFDQVIELKGIEQANQLLKEWGCIVPASPSWAGHQIIKFPRTRHVVNLGAATRDDLIMAEGEQKKYLNNPIYVEEKVDGANLGISIHNNQIHLQNRSHYITSKYHEQFKSIDKWLYQHSQDLWTVLEPDRHILYGEWMYACHSIPYERLPGYFIAFDLYDQYEGKFWSRRRLEEVLSTTQIPIVPLMEHKTFKTAAELKALVQRQSQFHDGRVEGAYCRIMDDKNEWLAGRAKIVRTDFLAGNEHWTRGGIRPNQLA